MANESENFDSTNETETTENTGEESQETSQEIDVEALQKENATLKAQKEHWRKKAEEKDQKPTEKPADQKVEPSKPELSQKDVLVLAKADVHEDDLNTVLEYAQFKKIPVGDALKDSVLKTILSQKAEERATANAANVTTARRTTSKVSDSAILSDLSKGNVPEPGSAEADRLFWARRAKK